MDVTPQTRAPIHTSHGAANDEQAALDGTAVSSEPFCVLRAALCVAQRRLLIIACTATKRHDVRLLPALDRYDGPSFRVLRRWICDHPQAATQLDVVVLSAEFGLIPAIQPIPDYDRRMTAARAGELRAQVRTALEQLVAVRSYRRVSLSAGAVYRRALGNLATIRGLPSVEHAPLGVGIGVQLSALKRWLDSA